MFSFRSKFVPWFSPQLSWSQIHKREPGHNMDQTEPPPQGRWDERGKKPGNLKVVLKIKPPKFRKGVKKLVRTPGRWMMELAAETTLRRRGDAAKTGTDTGIVGKDKTKEKKKAKLVVLRTISKVLEENQLIRQRLATLSQAN